MERKHWTILGNVCAILTLATAIVWISIGGFREGVISWLMVGAMIVFAITSATAIITSSGYINETEHIWKN